MRPSSTGCTHTLSHWQLPAMLQLLCSTACGPIGSCSPAIGNFAVPPSLSAPPPGEFSTRVGTPTRTLRHAPPWRCCHLQVCSRRGPHILRGLLFFGTCLEAAQGFKFRGSYHLCLLHLFNMQRPGDWKCPMWSVEKGDSQQSEDVNVLFQKQHT